MVHAEGFTASSASRGRTRAITLTGELDMATVPSLRAQLDVDARRRPGALVLDLSELTFMDCVGLEEVIRFARRARRAGWRLRIVRPPPRVARIFQLTDAARVLPLGEADD